MSLTMATRALVTAAQRRNRPQFNFMTGRMPIGAALTRPTADHDGTYFKLVEDASDLSGNGNHGTVADGVFVDGLIPGRALYLNREMGIGGRIDFGGSTDFDLETFTFEFWINPQSYTQGGGNSNIILARELYNTHGFRSGIWSDGGIAFWSTQSGGSFNIGVSDVGLAIGRSTHIAFTYDGTVARIKINGTTVTEQEGTYIIPVGSHLVLNGGAGGTIRADAIYDDFRIWNYARSDAEIAAQMNSPLSGHEPGLVGYWPFGHIEMSAATEHEPRFTYSPTTPSVNLVQESNRFSQGGIGKPWTHNGVTVTADVISVEGGTTHADKITATDSVNNRVEQIVQFEPNTTYAAAVKMKNIDSGRSRFNIGDTGVDVLWSGAQLSSHLDIGAGIVDSGYDDLGDGEYRVWCIFTTGETVGDIIRLYPDRATHDKAIYAWNIQVNKGAILKPYTENIASRTTSRLVGLLNEPEETNLIQNSYWQTGDEVDWENHGLDQAAFQVVAGGLLGFGDYHGRLSRITTGGNWEGTQQSIAGLTVGETYTVVLYCEGFIGTDLRLASTIGVSQSKLVEGWNFIPFIATAESGVLILRNTGGTEGDGVKLGFAGLVIGTPGSYIPNISTDGSATRSRDTLRLTMLDGVYDVIITRSDGVEILTNQVAAGGYVVPPSINPLQSVALSRKGLAFDFMQGQLPRGATLTRPTADHDGTYFDSGGVMQVANEHEPRFTYDPATLELAGLLNEPEWTNLWIWSSALSNLNAKAEDGAALGPDGTLSLAKFANDAGSRTFARVQDPGSGTKIVGGTDYLVRAVLRAGNTDYGGLYLADYAVNAGGQIVYQLTGAGAVTQKSTPVNDAGIIALGDGLYLCWAWLDTAVSSEYIRVSVGPADNGTPAFGGPGSEDGDYIYAGYLGIATGRDVPSHVPTVGSAVKRSRDTLTLDLADGMYDAIIVRKDSIETLLNQVAYGGYVVPTSPSPLQAVGFIPKPYVFDFMQGQLPSGAELTRPTSDHDGTYFDATGLMQVASEHEPRFTYNPTTLELEGLLNEPETTNALRHSNDVTQSLWTGRNDVSVAQGEEEDGPDGTADYSRISNLTGLGSNDIFQQLSGSLVAGARYEPSLRMRRVSTVGSIQISNPVNAANGLWIIDLSTLSDDWQYIIRDHPAVTITNEFTATDAGSGGLHLMRKSGATPLAVDVAFCKLERSATSSSDVRTEGSAATRSRDTLMLKVANGVYDVIITRADGIEIIPDQVVSGGYTVPTSVSPLQQVTFTPKA